MNQIKFSEIKVLDFQTLRDSIPQAVSQAVTTEEVHIRMSKLKGNGIYDLISIGKMAGKNRIRHAATVLCVLSMLISLMWAACLFSGGSDSYAEDNIATNTDNGYVTESFVVNMDVDKDCVYNVTEKIAVNFREPRRGIFRYIPYQNDNARIEDVEVVGEKSYITGSTNAKGSAVKVIRIGDPDKYITGRHEYTIKYKIIGIRNDLKPIRKPDDRTGFSGAFHDKQVRDGKEDLVYVDLVPGEWQTGINYVKATINFPKDVDWSKFKLFTGKYGSYSESENVTVNTDGRTAAFEAVNWEPNSGVTLYGNVGRDYWEGVENASRAFHRIYVITILLAVVIAALWFFFGRDKKYIKTVEFYPPEDMTPMEVGYVVDGKVDNEDKVSNFIYAAGRGYMDIEQDCQDEKKFTFRKKKDYDSDQFENEKNFVRLFIHNLFVKGDEVSSDDFPDVFLKDFGNVNSMIKDYYHGKRKLFTPASIAAQIFSGILFVIAIIYANIFVVSEMIYYTQFEILLISSVFDVIALITLMGIMSSFSYRQNNLNSKKKWAYIFGIVTVGIFELLVNGLLYFAVIGLPSLGIVVIACKIISLVMIAFMHKRSKYGTEIMGKLMGFRDFIEKAELPMIEGLVDKDPAYFYKILPYAYVFGLTGKWIKNFEGLKIDPPEWYNSGSYNMSSMAFPLYMASSLNNLNSGIQSSIMESISSSSDMGGGGISGGGIGGGFSGGGFGGGGGGAW